MLFEFEKLTAVATAALGLTHLRHPEALTRLFSASCNFEMGVVSRFLSERRPRHPSASAQHRRQRHPAGWEHFASGPPGLAPQPVPFAVALKFELL